MKSPPCMQNCIEFALRDAGFDYDEAFEIARNAVRYEWLKYTSPMGWPARILSDETLDEDGFDREIDKAMEESEWTAGTTE